MRVEVARLFVPASKLINDNYGQHYRTQMGKAKWLKTQASLLVEGSIAPCGFKLPPKEYVRSLTKDGTAFKLILEHWKCQQTFDLANYEMTFKPVIDVYSEAGYWKDDAWKYAWPVTFNGGDYSVWRQRAVRFEDDGLPDDIKRDWWEANGCDPKTYSFIRVIVDSEQVL